MLQKSNLAQSTGGQSTCCNPFRERRRSALPHMGLDQDQRVWSRIPLQGRFTSHNQQPLLKPLTAHTRRNTRCWVSADVTGGASIRESDESLGEGPWATAMQVTRPATKREHTVALEGGRQGSQAWHKVARRRRLRRRQLLPVSGIRPLVIVSAASLVAQITMLRSTNESPCTLAAVQPDKPATPIRTWVKISLIALRWKSATIFKVCTRAPRWVLANWGPIQLRLHGKKLFAVPAGMEETYEWPDLTALAGPA